ncbi:MAG: hypothetical protein L7F77_08695 [Candidatus Magnetominusculus sp. LBB02]|nr:hypothetical protein [Candidatus Magnetominusculus sp. LBB02]
MTRFDTTTIRFSDLADTMRVSEVEEVIAEINKILGELKEKPSLRLPRLIIDFNNVTMISSRLMGKIGEASQSPRIGGVDLVSVQEDIIDIARRYGFTADDSKIRIFPMFREMAVEVLE